MILRKLKKNKGFALLFAVTVSSILLAVAIGVADIALKEIRFGTSAKDTNDAFFAADTAIECALFNDKSTIANPPGLFPVAGPATSITCASGSITPVFTSPDPSNANAVLYTFTVITLGSSSPPIGCAKVSISKDTVVSAPSVVTKIISDGYNTGDASCNPAGPNRVQRELKVAY